MDTYHYKIKFAGDTSNIKKAKLLVYLGASRLDMVPMYRTFAFVSVDEVEQYLLSLDVKFEKVSKIGRITDKIKGLNKG